MRNVGITELKVGDIFTKELILKKREAFMVIEVLEKSLMCHSRNDPKINAKDLKKIKKEGRVYLLNDKK